MANMQIAHYANSNPKKASIIWKYLKVLTSSMSKIVQPTRNIMSEGNQKKLLQSKDMKNYHLPW